MTGNRFLGAVVLGVSVMAALAACGSPDDLAQPTYSPAVLGVPDNETQGYLSIKSAQGVTACGVFNVNGHGQKLVDLRNYPACAKSKLTVLCLNDKAQWIGDYVKGVTVGSNEVSFTSAQDGICGLFPAP